MYKREFRSNGCSRGKSRLFEHVEKINNDETIEKIREIEAERTREKDKAKNTSTKIIRVTYVLDG